jgi:aerobic-type carbon monoxide dehydrogenase small subunit (CoxS/CutS family)
VEEIVRVCEQIILEAKQKSKEEINPLLLLKVTRMRRNSSLTGGKRSCENGDCGSFTVLIEGLPVNSCAGLTENSQFYWKINMFS